MKERGGEYFLGRGTSKYNLLRLGKTLVFSMINKEASVYGEQVRRDPRRSGDLRCRKEPDHIGLGMPK